MIVSIIGLIILFNLKQYATEYAHADVVDSIRTEEETNHKVLLSKYVKAAISGAMTNLFPRVTIQEQTDAEKLLSEACSLFDPPLPDSHEQLDAKICDVHKERGKKILAYVRKRFPTHLITLICVRLVIDSYGRYHDSICKDTESRNHYLKNATVINQYVNGLNVARNKFIDNALVVVHSNTTARKVALLCCSYWSLKAGLINALPTQQLQNYYTKSIAKCDGDATKYLCLYHSEGSKACAHLVIPPPPTNVTRFTSASQGMVESAAKITQISL